MLELLFRAAGLSVCVLIFLHALAVVDGIVPSCPRRIAHAWVFLAVAAVAAGIALTFAVEMVLGAFGMLIVALMVVLLVERRQVRRGKRWMP